MWVSEINIIIWSRNITLDKNNIVYEKADAFQDDKEGLGKLILTDTDEINDLVTKIEYQRRGNESYTKRIDRIDNLSRQQKQYQYYQLDSTVNDLVDQFDDTGVEEGEFPQTRDDEYILTAAINQLESRSHPKRVRNPSQQVLDNVIHYNEIPIDDPEVYVNNAFASMENEPATYKEATQRSDSKKWYAAIEKKIRSLLNAGT
jgi:hypothetical protein